MTGIHLMPLTNSVIIKGNQLDVRLAKFINNFSDRQKLKIMFMRESDGVYQFDANTKIPKLHFLHGRCIVNSNHLGSMESRDQELMAQPETPACAG